MPIPTTDVLRHLHTVTWRAGLSLRRGHKRTHTDPTELVPGVGDTRFAPLRGVAHASVAGTTFAALLESALHDAAPPEPRVPEVVLSRWDEAGVVLTTDVRLIDLRDQALKNLGLDRGPLTATSAAHYPCTRVWAERLHGRQVGGQVTHGLVWNSRQLELHAPGRKESAGPQGVAGRAPGRGRGALVASVAHAPVRGIKRWTRSPGPWRWARLHRRCDRPAADRLAVARTACLYAR